MESKDLARWICNYRLSKYHEDINACRTAEERLAFLANTKPYEVIEGEGNCLQNTGIDEMWDLITGAVSGNDHIFSATYATIGVGDDDTAADPDDGDLLADPNVKYNAMEGGYPTSTDQKATFKASFATGEANYAWNEWVVKQSTSAKCLNRKVEALGTKTTGTWTLEVSITLS